MRDSFLAFYIRSLKGKRGSRATPEEKGLDQRPEDSMSTELREDVSRVDFSRYVEEPQDIRRDSFSDAVIRQRIVAFVEGRVRNIRTGNDACIVAKHVSLTIEWGTKAPECVSQVHDLFSA